MRATMIYGPHDIRVEHRPDPTIQGPGDAIVKVVRACVCGSDLWPYRGIRETPKPRPIGHEFIGVVEAVGDDVSRISVGGFVIAPFTINCGVCANCLRGLTTSCESLGVWGGSDAHGVPIDGAQAQYLRVPFADATLVPLPELPDAAMYPDLLALSDVMGTGHHAAVCANVGPGDAVVVVGDGAVGLCGVLAAHRLGAGRIIAMSRHSDRQALARRFGATDIVATRDDEGVAEVKDLLGGGADCVLECVGTDESLRQALGVLRPGGSLGFVGAPATNPKLPIGRLFANNFRLAGGIAPVRPYIDELLPDVLSGRITPGLVFDQAVPLENAADAYTMMDQRQSIKTMLLP